MPSWTRGDGFLAYWALLDRRDVCSRPEVVSMPGGRPACVGVPIDESVVVALRLLAVRAAALGTYASCRRHVSGHNVTI